MSFVYRMAGVLLVSSLIALPSAAQSLRTGVKAGVALTSLSNVRALTESAEEDAGIGIGPMIGGFLNIDWDVGIGLQPEVFFVTKGVSLNEHVSENGATAVTLTYLEIPLLAKLSPPSYGGTSWYLLAGPSIGFKLSSTIRYSDDREDDEEEIDRRTTGTDLGLTFGGGWEGEHWLVEGRFSPGLRNISSDPTEPVVKTRTFAMLAGIRF
ncbi:MAG: outer membrane beta-barrel protein [Luteitalea sp.]|nr:outer membrane beta-barrel protein [Luteitalea sp.]